MTEILDDKNVRWQIIVTSLSWLTPTDSAWQVFTLKTPCAPLIRSFLQLFTINPTLPLVGRSQCTACDDVTLREHTWPVTRRWETGVPDRASNWPDFHQMGQIWHFSRSVQNEQKTDLKKSQICPIWCQSVQLEAIKKPNEHKSELNCPRIVPFGTNMAQFEALPDIRDVSTMCSHHSTRTWLVGECQLSDVIPVITFTWQQLRNCPLIAFSSQI